jgi:septal ring factor EnvC (AmiA/AmiB activator)
MEIRSKKFETEFSVQATAMINYVLTSFEQTEEAINAQTKMIEDAQKEIQKAQEKIKSQTELYNDANKKNIEQRVEIERLNQFILDNNLSVSAVGEIPPQ